MASPTPFKSVGIAKELETDENPGGYDQRVIMNADAVRHLVGHGCRVSVQREAGVGIGIADEAYIAAGATIEDHDALYAGKDLVVKYKGPSARNIAAMSRGTTLFSMAHLDVFPARRRALADRGINVLTMERVRRWQEPPSRVRLRSQLLIERYVRGLDPHLSDRTVVFVGGGERSIGAFQTIARARPKQLFIVPRLNVERLLGLEEARDLLVVLNRAEADEGDAAARLRALGAMVINLDTVNDAEEDALLAANPHLLEPIEYGQRRIHCLFETGYCGTRYGLDLLARPGGRLACAADGTAVLLGYGNVSTGAIAALLETGIGLIRVMTRRDLVQSRLRPWFHRADIVVCAAEQDADLRGRNFYVTNRNIRDDIPDGAVVIDLIGGTPNKRCPVEALERTTFLPDVHFERDGVYIAGLWGWDLAGRIHESAETYSRQSLDVLLGEERLIEGLGVLSPGVEPALVLGPFAA